MGVFDKRQAISPKGQSPAPPKKIITPKPSVKKDTSFFGGKPYLQRRELRETLRKSSPIIPGSGGRILGREERIRLEKDVFGKKFGQAITPKKYEEGLKGLRKQESEAKTLAERQQIARKYRFLKGLGGKS